ncbi:helix-turn-helix transcriptional regulator [Klebsiella sp. MISC125]|uniref:helix-turn-helix transcriptional regulator n=1 Tax=Klebsiella sp. MISC125 TaxID=2755386 RepID=UPI003DA951B0
MKFLIISDSNVFFCIGIHSVILDVIKTLKIENFTIDTIEHQVDDIKQYDIIISALSINDMTICNPMYLKRKKTSKIFFLLDKNKFFHNNSYPLCLNGSVYLEKNVTRDYVSKILTDTINNIYLEKERCSFLTHLTCLACKSQKLTHKQQLLISGLASGLTIKEVCALMNIKYKTAMSHKSDIMKKFNIESKKQFIDFVNRQNYNYKK